MGAKAPVNKRFQQVFESTRNTDKVVNFSEKNDGEVHSDARTGVK